MKHSKTRSTCLPSPKTPKPRMYVVMGIVAMLVSSSAWSAQQASAVGDAVASAGDLDPTFGSGGKVTIDLAPDAGVDRINAIALQPDGKIVALGGERSSGLRSGTLARFNEDGTLDSSFGLLGGKVFLDFFAADSANALVIQTDGKIVAAGVVSNVGRGLDFGLVRYNADGSLDLSFGSDGKVSTDFGQFDVARAVALQVDGKILVAGWAPNVAINAFSSDFALVRYNPDGALDSTFGSGGKTTTDFLNGSFDFANAISLAPDGKILLAGGVEYGHLVTYFALARYNADGSLDSTFGSGGKVTTDFFGGIDQAQAIAVQPDSKIVVAGDATPIGGGLQDFALARYDPAGTLDSSFGTNGKVTTDFFGNGDFARALAVQRDGKIVAAGYVGTFTTTLVDVALARYNFNGALDTTVGSGGKVTTDFSGGVDEGRAMVLQPDGRIVIAGSADLDSALVRYKGDGVLCLQDDSNGNLLQFNSSTGDYQFVDCRKAITLTGTGKVTNDPSGCKITLQDMGPTPKRPDRSVLVQANRCTRAAIASIQIFSTGSSFSIRDSDITNNTCACR